MQKMGLAVLERGYGYFVAAYEIVQQADRSLIQALNLS
jgi:hypothetical protein